MHANDTHMDTLIVVRDQASALIRAEVRAGDQRAQLERAVHDAVNRLGKSIDDVSAASGLTPDEVRKIASRARDLEGDALAGIAA